MPLLYRKPTLLKHIAFYYEESHNWQEMKSCSFLANRICIVELSCLQHILSCHTSMWKYLKTREILCVLYINQISVCLYATQHILFHRSCLMANRYYSGISKFYTPTSAQIFRKPSPPILEHIAFYYGESQNRYEYLF